MIAHRDRPAFDAFVVSSSDRLLRTAYLLCGDRGHAEDLVQTALMRTARQWRRAWEFPEAYARRAVVNLAKDRWRQRGSRPAEAPLDMDVAEPQTDAFGDRDALLRAAQRLAPGQRAVLVLRYFSDLSVEETAVTLGCSAGTVKSQTARALENLRAAPIPAQEDLRVD
jgi:RNA polymerase sigma-70 factor (sigma-E family)